jgi:hypothetical protein
VDGVITYLNTDLYLESPGDMAPLMAGLRARGVSPLCDGPVRGDDGLWHVNCEANEAYGRPEDTIAALLSVIEGLDEAGRAAWDACTRREFNIGYDCGDEPWAFQEGISAELLRRMAAAGASLRWTLYPDREAREPPAASG